MRLYTGLNSARRLKLYDDARGCADYSNWFYTPLECSNGPIFAAVS